MSNFARYSLLGLFATSGIGAALAVANYAEPPHGDATIVQVQSSQTKADEHSRIHGSDWRPPIPEVTAAKPAVTQNITHSETKAEKPTAHADAHRETVAALSDVVKTLSKAVADQSQQKTAEAAAVRPAEKPAARTSPTAPRKTGVPPSPLEDIAAGLARPRTRSSAAELANPAGAPQITAEGDGRLAINCRDSDIREVLEMISQQGGMNIVASKSVTGKITATLSNVDLESAMTMLLKSTGFSWRRDGKFIFVGTQADFKTADNSSDQIGTRVYRPNYVTARELELLITPLLTETIGRVKAATPAKSGIGADGSSAGGDDFAGGEAVIVRDYENVLRMIDQLVEEMDCRPTQVAIEAMILSVKLDDTHKFGVDFEFLRNKRNLTFATGSPVSDLGQISFDDGGLKFGFLDTTLGAFLEAVESIGDANIIATPRVLCLNRQRAEILIGAQLGYVNTTQTETASTQAVDFLEVGTQLRIRPFIASDGMVRLEVHPELSTGTVRVEQNFTLPDKEVTQVTSNVMVRDGSTVVIGGLLRDELTETANQVPLLGSLPWIGAAFRSSTQSTERREILILITPHVVYEPKASYEGDKAAREFHHRHMVYSDKMSPIGKRLLGRKYFHKAQEAWTQGKQKQALNLINLSIDIDPLSRAAVDLRSDITSNVRSGDHTDVHQPRVGPGIHPLDGELVAPWASGKFEPGESFPLRHPVDGGSSGSARTFEQQGTTP